MSTTLDIAKIRAQFPALNQTVHKKPLAYLDSAATSQKPQAVIDATSYYYSNDNANVHRAVYELGARATQAYERARETVRKFLGAASSREIIFVKGATEGINLVANVLRSRIAPMQTILISEMEHHANIVPWQLIAEETGATLRVIPLDSNGELDFDVAKILIEERPRVVALTHVSNVLGTVNPIAALIELAHAQGAITLVDGSQATPHMRVNVQDIGCDFYVFSGHKVYGPTGIGALYGRAELLETLPPWQGGGDMIETVTFENSTYAPYPQRFEAGTPNIAGAIGLAAAIDYLESLTIDRIVARERLLMGRAEEALQKLPFITILGSPAYRVPLLSFLVEGVHAHDVATLLDLAGIAARAGHHCAQPLMNHYGVPATTRASFSFYNTEEEVERLASALEAIHGRFSNAV
jgi:cysteine desulfurase/selenocysteine lyase